VQTIQTPLGDQRQNHWIAHKRLARDSTLGHVISKLLADTAYLPGGR
jgi:hypothetical protein